MNLLDQATDWRNHTNEERAEHCVAFLHTMGVFFDAPADYQRALNRIRARGDSQREERARQ